MKNLKILSSMLLLLIGISCQSGKSQDVNPNGKIETTSNGELHAYKNLAIYLIQGEDQIDRKYITLEEAMRKSCITLHETGNVGELSVDNNSNEYVFILSGDIVKGGRQDRTIGEDIILKPHCKNIPLKSFCVEQSRWRQRGSESSVQFSSSDKILSNKNLKIAARAKKEQGAVWNEVSEFQQKAGENIKKDIKNEVSATSLQLTLEDKDLEKTVKEYVDAMQPFFKGKKDVLGFAFCINGKISTIEFFGNADLFARLQKKLLESAANEAVFQYNEKADFQHPKISAIETFISMAAKGKEIITETGENTVEKRYQTDESIMFRTYNTDAGNKPVHEAIFSTEGVNMQTNNIEINQRMNISGGYRKAMGRN